MYDNTDRFNRQLCGGSPLNDMMKVRYPFPRNAVSLMRRVYKHGIPEVRKEFARWREQANLIPDAELRYQALDSLGNKQFHCDGGSVYAVANMAQFHNLLPLIVAFQTICDYADNLSDRPQCTNVEDFRLLHQALLDAIVPGVEPRDYYVFNSESEVGYMSTLVKACQGYISELPDYDIVYPYLRDLVELYCGLQTYKHIAPELRQATLMEWWSEHKHRTPHLYWHEFAAATGSTLGIFMMFLAASGLPGMNDAAAKQAHAAYFPNVCCLHIMLDYVIDQEEDQHSGDLNFCDYYDPSTKVIDRIEKIVDWARADVQQLPGASFHLMIVEGLVALYLTDPKVKTQQEVRAISKRLLRKGPPMRAFFILNSQVIRKYL